MILSTSEGGSQGIGEVVDHGEYNNETGPNPDGGKLFWRGTVRFGDPRRPCRIAVSQRRAVGHWPMCAKDDVSVHAVRA